MKKILIAKIEKKFIRLIEAEDTKTELQTKSSTDFHIPDYMEESLMTKPEELADYIDTCIKNCSTDAKDMVLLFDSNLGFFREFRYRKSDKETTDKRYFIEEDNVASGGAAKITQRLSYPQIEDDGDMRRAAIYGIDDKFLRALVKNLKKNQIKVIYASSSLVIYKLSVQQLIEKMDPAKLRKRIIGIDLEGDSFRMVVTDDGELIHMEESGVPPGAKPEDKNITDMLTELLEEYRANKKDTLVVVSGKDIDAEAKRLMRYSGITCKSSKSFTDAISDSEKKISAEEFSTTGLDLKGHSNDSYLYGGWSKRRFSKATAKICIAAAVLIAILFSMLPAYTYYLTNENTKLNAEIAKDKYDEQLDLINENRDILSSLQAYRNDQQLIGEDSVSYGEILTLLREELLSDATINDLFYDEKSGLIIDCDIKDPGEFKSTMDKLNDERKIFIVETSTGAAISGSGQNIQIKVTLPNSQGGGS